MWVDKIGKKLYNFMRQFNSVAERMEERKVIVMNEENNIFDVCDFILFYETVVNRCPVTNLRIQKLLYFIQAAFLEELGQLCFRARMEAWHYGPVIPDVYRRYKGYGSFGIEPSHFPGIETVADRINHRELIEDVLTECREMSTSRLVEITHRQAPWNDSYQQDNAEITEDSLRTYFTEG